MSDDEFQRARSEKQKEERRLSILAAAREMLLENTSERELSLNEVARRAGMAKSNVYRYFESREAVLLELLRQAWIHWFEELEREFNEHPLEVPRLGKRSQSKNDAAPAVIDQLASKLSSTFAREPLLGHLCSILASVLEHNVEVTTVRAFKYDSLDFVRRLGQFLHAQYPAISPQGYEELFHSSFAAMVGLWSLSHPSEAVAAVLQEPDLAPFRHDFARDFARHLSLLARGLAATSGEK